jgi:hypothetical protein
MPLRERLLQMVKRHPVLAAGVGIGLAMLAAVATPDGVPFLDAERPQRVVVPRAPAALMYMLVALGLMLVVLSLVLRISVIKEVETHRRQSIWPSVIILFLVLALWANSPALRQWLGRDVVDNQETQQQRGSEDDQFAPERDRSPLYGYGLTAIVGLLLVAVAVIFFVMFAPARRRTEPNLKGPRDDPQLLGEIDAGIEDLEGITDPREAILAAYARMQALTEFAGVDRRLSDTPHELLDRLLSDHRVEPGSARRLTELFERAKFSERRVDETTRREAIDALRRIRSELLVPA